MTSLAYGYIELFICLRFPMAATGINKGASLFDAASGPFKFQIGTLMWLCGTLKICLIFFFFFYVRSYSGLLNVAIGYLSVNS